MPLFYPEGSLSPLGFIASFFILYCLLQLGRGLAVGITGRQEIYHRKIHWFSLFIGLFILYLIINWTDISANTWRGYEAGVQLEREELLKLFRDLPK